MARKDTPKGPRGPSITLDAEGRHRRARLSANSKHHPDRPDLLDPDRRWLKAAAAEVYIRQVVDSLPPLTDTQRRKLAALLHPGGDGDAAAT
jgi:hypothetical protein